MDFIKRLQPAPVDGGFYMDDYWIWCGSAIAGPEGDFHLYAARWPKTYPFFEGYKLYSEIVHATSPTPEGPYTFKDVALPARGEAYWDGRMTHNPTIHQVGDTYLLFYIGSTWSGPDVPPEDAAESSKQNESYANIQIGLATSKSLDGPWERRDEPILRPRSGKWDSSIVTNPAPCILDDGSIVMLYRANTPEGLRLGVARAVNYESPFVRLADNPVLVFEDGNYVEDPFIWWTGERFELLAKDMTGGISGEKHAGIHAYSSDAIHWILSKPAKAYSRVIHWDDGTTTTQGSLERPQLLFQDGMATHLFAATADGPGGFRNASRTWNMVIPLTPEF